jgi:hypothetical protein
MVWGVMWHPITRSGSPVAFWTLVGATAAAAVLGLFVAALGLWLAF